MKKIIDPVPVELIKAELTKDKKLINTNRGNNEIYVVTGNDSPNVLREIGRLRELSFRTAGGSTGNAIDLDEFDSMESPYRQLIVWDPDEEAIIGGYRFLFGSDARMDENGQPILASAHQFHFSQNFIEDYLPHMMELGRNFVVPAYQSSKAGARSIFAMDNLWDGLMAIIIKNPNLLYVFGKVTIYPSYDKITRDLTYHFLWKHFGDKEKLVFPKEDTAVLPQSDPALMDLILNQTDILEDYKLLKNAARMRNVNIPPNFSAYISITPMMHMFGTSVNRLMNDIEDTGILIPIDSIYQEKIRRHVGAYLKFTLKNGRKKSAKDGIEDMEEMVNRWFRSRARIVRRIKRQFRKAKRDQVTKDEDI